MITISFYSYKGGVGRSLALTNLAVYLAQFGVKVVMADFDLEAPGLHYKLRPEEPLSLPSRGVAGVLADVCAGAPFDEIDWDISIDITEHANPPQVEQQELWQDDGRLLLIPAGDPMLPDYWHDLGRIDWDMLFTRQPRPGVAALAKLKQDLIERYDPDVLLVDSRTGITPGGGVSITLLPDVVVTMLLNTREHLDGSRMVVSAVTQSRTAEVPSPRVVPVLSRYSSQLPPARRPTSLAARRRMLTTQPDPEDEAVPLEELRTKLIVGLPAQDAGQVSEALVLHHDPALARNERLAFGRYAGFEAEGPGQALVEDYVRLFRALVPKDTFMRSLPGVRARVRSIVLDRPDDALRTLESLATMVGDEDAFGDLVKLYVLRRDMRNLVRSAERLFRMHGRVVVNPALSEELRAVALGERPQRPDSLPGRRFMEAYWRAVAPDDVAWGATVVRRIADAGEVTRARELAAELAESAPDADSLGSLVRLIAAGNPDAEKLAVAIALKYFGSGVVSSEFLDAAALACTYEPNKTLASRVLEAPGARNLPMARLVPVLEAAEHYEDADQIVVETLAEMEPYADVAPWLLAAWQRATRRDPTVRSALTHRNGEMVEYLDDLGAQEA
jgi:hypothetical protein